MAEKPPKAEKVIAENRRARHEYHIDERYEAGMVLLGNEVKALREGKGQIQEAYAIVRNDEAFLLGMHIAPYSGASTHVEIEPRRERKLLLHRREIEYLGKQTLAKGLTLIPLRVYFKAGKAKVELGLARGKQQRDRRREIADRDAKREADRALRNRQR